MLIDAGTAEAGFDVVSYIEGLGYNRIDYLVATHPHEDHIGGLPLVFGFFEVGEVWAPKVAHTSQAYDNFLDAVWREGLTIDSAVAGKRIGGTGCYELSVLSPVEGVSYSDLNDWSVVIELAYGTGSFLFTGDASADVIQDANPGHVDVLKVGHHGSRTSTSDGLVAQISPTFAVISCGAGNLYGHPHQETLAALQSAAVLRTDLDGTIVARTRGEGISVA